MSESFLIYLTYRIFTGILICYTYAVVKYYNFAFSINQIILKAMKKIIERNLPLNLHYTLINKQYIPLLEGFGCTCSNCNKLIANIATVKSENNKTYDVGFDCLDTLLQNNMLLDNKSIEDYEHYKTHLPQYIRVSKNLKDNILEHNKTNPNKITSLIFDVTDFKKWIKYAKKEKDKTCFTFYYGFLSGGKYNDYVKVSSYINISDFFNVVKNVTGLTIQEI